VLTSQPRGDEDSVALARALADVPLQMATTDAQRRLAQLFVHVRVGISRLLLGDEAVDQLGLARHPAQHAAKLLVPVIAGLDRVRRVMPGGDKLALALGRRYLGALASA
jgi:hypothetical protein